MNCFNNIIGISRTEHSCFTDSFSADARKSESGLFLDEAEGFPELTVFNAIAKNQQLTLEEKLTKARVDGISFFKEELYRGLGARYSVKSEAYIGNVGQSGSNGYLNINYPFAGVAFDMQPYRGATVVVSGVQPFFNFDGALEIKVYKAYSNGLKYVIIEEVKNFNINASISALYQDITPFTLDTTDDTGKALSYLFIYSVDGHSPRDNSTSCGCGGKESILHQYVKPKGIMGASHDEMLISNRTDKINGLLFKVQARCTGGDFICYNYENNELIRESINWAIQRKSASAAMVGILTSDLVNHYTMAKREQIAHSVNILNSKFKKSVAWIAENMDLSNNDCFNCNSGGNNGPFSIQKDGILL